MTNLRTAAQQALEALEKVGLRADARRGCDEAVGILRAALAQQDEPCPCGERPADQCLGEWEPGCDLGNNPKYAKRVNLAEPVAWIYQNAYTEQEYLVWKKGTGGRNWKPLYIAPPQRKPLTDEEIDRCWYESGGLSLKFASAIERAHGIKEQA